MASAKDAHPPDAPRANRTRRSAGRAIVRPARCRKSKDHRLQRKPPQEQGPELKAELAKLAFDAPPEPLHVGARLRNYFLTGLVVVGPVTITLYIAWYFINIVDAWVKPYIPRIYNPESYLPFPIPGVGLLFAIVGLTLIGALAANLLGPLADQCRRDDARRACRSCATSTRASSRSSNRW